MIGFFFYLRGKKQNVKHTNYYNSCIKKKMINSYGPIQAITSAVNYVANKQWKKAFTLVVKSGFKSSLPGFIVTATHIQLTCMSAADKKYKACI